jgi:hypothetical protein
VESSSQNLNIEKFRKILSWIQVLWILIYFSFLASFFLVYRCTYKHGKYSPLWGTPQLPVDGLGQECLLGDVLSEERVWKSKRQTWNWEMYFCN